MTDSQSNVTPIAIDAILNPTREKIFDLRLDNAVRAAIGHTAEAWKALDSALFAAASDSWSAIQYAKVVIPGYSALSDGGNAMVAAKGGGASLVSHPSFHADGARWWRGLVDAFGTALSQEQAAAVRAGCRFDRDGGEARAARTIEGLARVAAALEARDAKRAEIAAARERLARDAQTRVDAGEIADEDALLAFVESRAGFYGPIPVYDPADLIV